MLSLPQLQTHRQLQLHRQLLRHPPWEPLGLRTLRLHPLLKPGLRRLPLQRAHQRLRLLQQMNPRVLLRQRPQRQLLPPPQITVVLVLALLWKACKQKLLR